MKLMSPWGEKINKKGPLPDYPRMTLQRDSYFSLNGEWQFQITDGSEPLEENWETIIVPFALGSTLSGTDKQLKPGETLWYRKYFTYPITKNQIVLNFEAVDQRCEVLLNGLPVGSHEGGYTPFEFDVSDCMKQTNELIVKCYDDSERGNYVYGKQKLEHGGMWYTPSSGIWQSVWLEELKKGSVHDIKITVDYDSGLVYLIMAGHFQQACITVFAGKKLVHRGITVEKEYTIPLDNFHPWTPEDPFLYDLYIETEDETVKSYFGMRKFSVGKDSTGITRFLLNNEPIFLTGLLDQGYSCDGLMTYPSDEAMRYELETIKRLGFNMLRKHVKQECRRWYYLCDVLGILVMQDMPNGGGPYDFKLTAVKPNIGLRSFKDDQYEKLGRQSEEGRDMYYKELDAMLESLYNYVSIFAWVPFNEGWGQFDSAKVTDYIHDYDSTRLVDSASGWFDQGAGDFASRHVYFVGFKAPKLDHRILLLSEFGGFAYLEHGHSVVDKLYGYKKFKDKLELNEAIERLYQKDVISQIPRGLSGCIYTQVSDVEDECNGLFTYDRKVLKVDEVMMMRINEKCKRSIKK